MFAPWPRKMGAHVDIPLFTRYVDGWLRFLRYTCTSMHCKMAGVVCCRVDARSCMNVFGTSDSKYYLRQSLWDDWRRVSRCPTNWWAFLLPASYLALCYVVTPARSLRSADAPMLIASRVRTFSVAVYNSLPADIRLCASIYSFKGHFKTHLFMSP